ncbi:MAG: hypothetical protein LBC77_07595 [Spirochaetaceae bacterium]|jgi:hypothetical protein|nr:hypothetical protein [Spirochaetaceae bacterium]
MVKTFEEYYNDPDIIHEPSALREIHAIRLKIHDERQGLSVKEYNDIVDQRTASFFAEAKAMREKENGV